MKRSVLAFILVLAFFLRIVGIDKFPVGFTPDEASFGYDAYSILKTGKDQWGKPFPLMLESFGDYKSPLYSYLTIPFMAVFGLNKFAVRLPNAVLGTAAVFITYLLARQLFSKKKSFDFFILNFEFGEIAAFLLAISPWHIMMSRGAFEANLTTFFLPLAIYLFLKGLKDHKFLVWSAIVFGLNLFTYHSAKLVTPLVVVLLIFLFRKELAKIEKKQIWISGFIFLVFLILTGYIFFSGAATRAQDVSIFRGALEEQAPKRLAAIESGMDPFLARLIHNKYLTVGRRFLNNYFQYFSFKFLFTDGPAEATYGMIPGRGVLYWFELPFLIGLLIYLVREKKKRPILLIIAWLLLAPIPAALATGRGYAGNRAVVMLPALQIVLAIGVLQVTKILKNKYLLIAYFFASLIFFVLFLKDYFVQSPEKTAKEMLYGNLEAAYWIKDNVVNREIVVSRKLSEPHIYIAFANKWNPGEYQKFTKTWKYKDQELGWVDQQPEYNLGNYTFKNIDWKKDSQTNNLLVGKREEFPKNVSVLARFGEVLIVDPNYEIFAKK
jgi:4-amino-4-deoxy-L-arabinose transferase-like glycosyltransferase